MAVFKDTTITDNGRTLIADALANNRQITFTRMITSSKSYEDSIDASKLISIDEIKQSVNMTRISQEGTKVRLNAIFTNSAVSTSYKIQTIGLYAKIGTGNEILYSVTRAKEPDTMPATNGINLSTVEIDLITEINNSNGAIMLMNPSSLVTISSLTAELEKIIGLEFGGNIQDIGNKIKGKFYFDSVTKFYYECIADTNLTYNESSKFRAISNKPNVDKLENLFKIKEYTFDFSGITVGKILKNGNIATLIIDSGSYFYNKPSGSVVLKIPFDFIPKSMINFNSTSLVGVNNNFRIDTSGNLIKLNSDSVQGAYYFTVTYICA